MNRSRIMRMALVALPCLMFSVHLQAQTLVVPSVRFVDKTTGKSQEWEASASASENQGFNFPASAGVAGNVLKVTSASNGVATFTWSNGGGVSIAETSQRLDTSVVESAAWDTGPDINVTSGKKYRIVGEFAISRGTTVGGNEDKFKLRINLPSSNSSVAYAIECLDCPSGTTTVPIFIADTASNVEVTATPNAAIDPNGSYESETFHYRIEGILKAAATGTARLTFNKSQGSSDTKMWKHSYWALIEVQ